MTSGQVTTRSEGWVLLPFLDIFGKVGFPTTAVYSWRTVKEAASDRLAGPDDNEYDIVRRLYRAYVGSDDPKQLMLDKTPRYYLVAEDLLRVFPSSKVVVITRDLNDIVSSIRNTWEHGRLNLYHTWLDLRLGPRLLDSFITSHRDDNRVLRIAYEDVQQVPSTVERELQQFLGLPTIDFSKLGHSSVDGALGDPSNRDSAHIVSSDRTNRTTLVQHLLVRYVFGKGVAECWKRRLPELSYNPLSNALDLLWTFVSLTAIILKVSQLKVTMPHVYKWS